MAWTMPLFISCGGSRFTFGITLGLLYATANFSASCWTTHYISRARVSPTSLTGINANGGTCLLFAAHSLASMCCIT